MMTINITPLHFQRREDSKNMRVKGTSHMFAIPFEHKPNAQSGERIRVAVHQKGGIKTYKGHVVDILPPLTLDKKQRELYLSRATRFITPFVAKMIDLSEDEDGLFCCEDYMLYLEVFFIQNGVTCLV